MPRRRRGFLDHSCYHLTHRCHKREFLLKFKADRQRYVDLLRETSRRYRIDVLNYIVTSNHVHILVYARKGAEIARAMQYLQGTFGGYYNRRKRRSGAFWCDRYHSTLIESGHHLGRCLFYIDSNMVRAGVVNAPEEWLHAGCHELDGSRRRYRVINQQRLMKCLRLGADVEAFRAWYLQTRGVQLADASLRQPYWTEAIAVGSRDWVQATYDFFGYSRKGIRPATYQATPDDNISSVAEDRAAYYIDG